MIFVLTEQRVNGRIEIRRVDDDERAPTLRIPYRHRWQRIDH